MSQAALLQGVRHCVERYLRRFETSGWNRYTDFAYGDIRPELLTEQQLSALRTAMLVEDHIPGYAKAYHRLFELDPGLPDVELDTRRAMLHFVFKWTSDEDRHAHTLENYIRATGRIDEADLSKEMRIATGKQYAAPHEDPMQMAVYTVIQEKATQVFYSCLRDAVEEPVLKQVLDALSKDEARHCGFFADLLRTYMAEPGTHDFAKVKEAVQVFKMPLYGTLDDYKRRSINMMRAAPGYHYRDAFVLIRQALGRFADARTDSRSTSLQDLLEALDVRIVRPAAGQRAIA